MQADNQNPTVDTAKANLDALQDGLERLATKVLSEDQAEPGVERLMGIVQTAHGWQLQLASDGLLLDAKLALERRLLAALQADEQLADTKLTIYFRRRQGASSAAGAEPTAVASPAPIKRQSPFGLEINRRAIPGVREVIVVASGKGGVGKSTVSCNLAVALAAQGMRVGLLDADIYGPSAPLMMGLSGQMRVAAAEAKPGEDFTGERLVPIEAHGVKTVSFGFLTDTRQPVIWRGPLVAKALKQFCFEVAWGELDYLVIDLPPGTGDVQLALIENLPIHFALIVTTPQDVALLDAHKALTMFERLDVPVLGLVENMSHFTCPKCGHEEPIFGVGGGDRMAAERKLKVLERIPLALAVRSHGDSGQPIALDADSAHAKPFHALARLCRDPLSLK